MNRLLFKLTAFLVFFSSICAAQEGPGVRLRSGSFTLPAPDDVLLDSLNRTLPRVSGKSLLLLQFADIPDADARKRLSAAGVEIGQYVPDNAYTAVVSGSLSRSALESGGVRGIWALLPEQKMDPILLTGRLPVWALSVAGMVDVLVHVPLSFSIGEAVALFNERGFKITSLEWSSAHVLGLQVPITQLRALAALPCLDYMQPAPPAPQMLNYNNRSTSRATVLQLSTSSGGRNLQGAGVVLGVGDAANVLSHIDFSGRLIHRAALFLDNHGVHVTGTLGGAGLLNELYKGIAPKSTIVSQIFDGILKNAATYHHDFGMVLTNNSYGNVIDCSYHGTYDIYSQLIDQQAIDIPDLTHVFAAGNSGASACAPYTSGYHTVLGGWQSAKNVISVGATTDSSLLSGFSSRGPVRDGRLKPEIMAQGSAVISTGANNSYFSNQGTSMAAPTVSGGLGLLVERYRQINGGANPKGALLKAVLFNGATDLGNAGPDFQYGYGWMNLLRSVEMLEQSRYFIATVGQGAQSAHSITVPANQAQLKVLLYWHDPAAALIATKELVNDLDLEVIDPTGAVVLPFVLDTANLAQPATRGADHINNSEQVTINNPVPGVYTLRIKGSMVAQGPQEYVLSYDPVPVTLQLTNPAGEAWVPGEAMKLQWDAWGNTTSTYAIDYSVDNGANWIGVATGLAATRRVYTWVVPAVATANARMRITQESTGLSSTSPAFPIMQLPALSLAPATSQCEGYINLNWTSVSGATDYEVMLLRGSEMVQVATTTATTFLLRGLSRDSVYWCTVRPRINGVAGRRAVAISRLPDNGSCQGAISNNDLKLAGILVPATGRLNTSSALGNAVPLTIQVRNLDDAPVSGFDLSYRINNGSWLTQSVAATIAAGATYTYTFPGTLDLSAAGSYTLVMAVHNLAADPVPQNDTLLSILRQLPNNPVALPFSDNLEGLAPATYMADRLGIDGDERFDYQHASTVARLRTQLETGFALSGTRAFTMDQLYNSGGGSHFLIGTFNLVGADAASQDIRLQFAFLNHGQVANADNKVWVRGNDGAPWLEAFDLVAAQGDAGTYVQSASIQLSRVLAAGGQNFSSSFQVRWGQNGSFPAVDPGGASGYSFDDIRLYEVQNDMQALAIVNLPASNCALSVGSTISVKVRNNAFTTLTGVPVRYRVGTGAWVTETLASIPAGAEVVYTFSTRADLSAFGAQVVAAIVDYPSDNLRANDTVYYTVVNSPVVSSFPYLENFEGAGNWYTGGTNSSWALGTPASQRLQRAASGVRAWKTRLAGHYNDKERSYLYSPCFNISALSNPMLSFALALDVEDCGASLCDAAWVEYSADGLTWTKLGANGTGTNWYNKGGATQVWSSQAGMVWRVASTPLPAGLTQLRLRFVMSSDEGVNLEGIAVDDIHIFDNAGIYEGPSIVSPLSQAISGSGWINYTSGGKLIASIKPNGSNLETTSLQVFIDTTTSRYFNNQYVLGRNLTIKPRTRIFADSVDLRLFFTDREAVKLIGASGCTTCPRPLSAFDLGIAKYSDVDTALEDNDLANDISGIWNYFGRDRRALVPYDKGYYAEFRVKSFSEFWFATGLPGQGIQPASNLHFTAYRSGGDAVLEWQVATEQQVLRYELEVAAGETALQQGQFVLLGTFPSGAGSRYGFTDSRPGKTGTYYYRLRVRFLDGSSQLSDVRPVLFTDTFVPYVYPNPTAGPFFLTFQDVEGAPVNMRLYDMGGRQVQQWSTKATGFVQKFAIDLQTKVYAAGVYLLRADIGAKDHLFRVFKY
jgi:hypothetical protein